MADEDEQKRLDDLNERIDRSIRRERRLELIERSCANAWLQCGHESTDIEGTTVAISTTLDERPKAKRIVSWANPGAMAALGRWLIKTEQRIAAERSPQDVNWTDKDYRELNRLLKKAALYAASRYPSLSAFLTEAEQSSGLIDPARYTKLFEDEDGRLYLVLGTWCAAVERHFGKKRHPAILWLVKQYKDKEDEKTFMRMFGGGTPDSIARRIYQKATAAGAFNHLSAYTDNLARDANGDLYQFTFKLVGSWPEPGLATVVYWLARHRQHLDKEDSEIFQNVFGTVDDGISPYKLASIARKKDWPDLEYWSECRARVEHPKKSQSEADPHPHIIRQRGV
jgi:hypothetical protein